MATGRLGAAQCATLAGLLERFGREDRARVILIHHPPLASGQAYLRRLTDAAPFERVVRRFGAELILHGHNHRRMTNAWTSPAANTPGGRIAILGAPSASSTARHQLERAAYHLVALARDAGLWRISARARGLLADSAEIGELAPLPI